MLYSTAYQWSTIVGTVPPASPLHALPEWVAVGPDQLADAEAACLAAALTAGPTMLARYVEEGVDRDTARS